MDRFIINPAYEAAQYEVTLLYDGQGWPHPYPYPYRYARIEDYDPTNPRRNSVPPFIVVDGEGGDVAAFTSVDAAHKLVLSDAATDTTLASTSSTGSTTTPAAP